MTDKIKHFIQVLQDAECLSDTIEDICYDGFELGYLYATNSEFKEFFNECVALYESHLESLRTRSLEDSLIAKSSYELQLNHYKIEERYREFIRNILEEQP